MPTVPPIEIEPAQDTRPIPFKALTAEQVETLTAINRLLQAIQADNAKDRPMSPEDPWAQVDANLSQRVIMINGVRGAGKTAMLLTLLNGWREALSPAGWRTLTDSAGDQNTTQIEKQRKTQFEEAFIATASTLRPLKPIDFDPLPPDLPLYGWIVQSIRPLVDWLEQKSATSTWGRAGPDNDWVENSKTLVEKWRDLYQTAIVGWGSGKLREAFQKDLYDVVLDQADQNTNWQQLQSQWRKFLDEIFQYLDQQPAIFPAKGLLVLPIDDVDLQVERVRELILAIRVLYHPRLVYLLTGDKDHLERILHLSFLGRMAQMAHGFEENNQLDQAEPLAVALANKVLAPSHVFNTHGFKIADIFKQSIETYLPEISDIVKKWCDNLAGDLRIYARDFQQLHDKLANSQEQPLSIRVGYFLEGIKGNDNPDDFAVTHWDGKRITVQAHSGRIIPIPVTPRAWQRYKTNSPLLDVCVSDDKELRFYRVNWQDDNRRNMVPVAPVTLLAMELAEEFPDLLCFEEPPRLQPINSLAWSVFKYGIREHLIPWPSITLTTPLTVLSWTNDWVDALDSLGEAGEVDRMALLWIYMHLQWLRDNNDTLKDDELQKKLIRQDPFQKRNRTKWKLDHIKWKKDSVSDLQKQFFDGVCIPVLEHIPERVSWLISLFTLPEYGLSNKLQNGLWDALQRLPQPISNDDLQGIRENKIQEIVSVISSFDMLEWREAIRQFDKDDETSFVKELLRRIDNRNTNIHTNIHSRPPHLPVQADVALLTTNSIESNALLTLLKERDIEYKNPKIEARYYYTFNLQCGSDSCLACVHVQPANMDPYSTASLVADLVRNFQPSLLLMVGVCAGFNERGVKVGDVLAAQQIFSYERERLKAQDKSQSLLEYPCNEPLLGIFSSNTGILNEILDGSVAHVCAYAAGEKILPDAADAPLRTKILSTSIDIRGLELEGHNLLQAIWEAKRRGIRVEIGLIKGVSDLVDEQVTEEVKWSAQEPAARKAAQVALAALAHYSPEKPA